MAEIRLIAFSLRGDTNVGCRFVPQTDTKYCIESKAGQMHYAA